MHDLFFLKIFKTHSDSINKYDNDGVIELIANRKSAFDIHFYFSQLGYKYIEVHDCATGTPIDFNYGLWGKTDPLSKGRS